MPDITKCTGVNCPFRDECYRYTSRDASKQSYLGIIYNEGSCTYFWPVEEETPGWLQRSWYKYGRLIGWAVFMGLIYLMSL